MVYLVMFTQYTSGTARTYPESDGSSTTRSTRVALRGSRGASTMPLTKLFSEAPHKLLAGFDGDHHQAVQAPPACNSIT